MMILLHDFWLTREEGNIDANSSVVKATFQAVKSDDEKVEDAGFDWIGCNEHHMSPYGLMPNPNLVGAIVANRTKTAGILQSGVIVPIIMKKMNLDPAASSAVVVTTFTDIAGVLLYMGLATFIILGI